MPVYDINLFIKYLVYQFTMFKPDSDSGATIIVRKCKVWLNKIKFFLIRFTNGRNNQTGFGNVAAI